MPHQFEKKFKNRAEKIMSAMNQTKYTLTWNLEGS
jgi:hypothetical protein